MNQRIDIPIPELPEHLWKRVDRIRCDGELELRCKIQEWWSESEAKLGRHVLQLSLSREQQVELFHLLIERVRSTATAELLAYAETLLSHEEFQRVANTLAEAAIQEARTLWADITRPVLLAPDFVLGYVDYEIDEREVMASCVALEAGLVIERMVASVKLLRLGGKIEPDPVVVLETCHPETCRGGLPEDPLTTAHFSPAKAAGIVADPAPAQTQTMPAAPISIEKKKRGRPQTIAEEKKTAAADLKASGGTNKQAAVLLYGTKHPTDQQKKNVPAILRHHQQKSKRFGFASQPRKPL